ncbi:efflux transporter outer membrane subunit [Phaeocystidibacter luteus]|uniref:Efflux transporter outer membrane subunit n=2 Tax=Phaeocystidibacter luteus TaxID=911197 RepID=A0A6N6RM91_9FLAO|nr:efflux transporter outer membrane subunit [Phaeocystidibacter luteus]
MRNMKNILLLLLTLVIVQCKVGPDYEQPEMDVPVDWQVVDQSFTIDSTAVPREWWTYFNDPVLDSLIRLSLVNNRSALIAAERVERARNVLGIQKAELLPKFNYFGQATRGNFANGQVLGNEITVLSTGASMSWELDFWGKYRRLNESARAQMMSDIFAQRALQISLIYEVSATYFQLLEYRKRLEIAKSTTQLRDSTLDLITDRFEGGIIPEIDVNQAQIQYAISASSIPLYKRLSQQTEQVLSVLVGVPPQEIPSGLPLKDQNFEQEVHIAIPSEMLRYRPDVLQAEQDLISANAIIGVRVAELFPSISLTGTLAAAGDPTTFGSGAAWNLGAGLAGPLFYWQQNLRRVDVAENDTKIALLNYEQTVLDAIREVEKSLVDIQTLREEVVARQLHVDAAQAAQDLSYMRYDQGVTSYLEYLETQRQLFEAQNFLATTQAQLLSAYLDLYRAAGGGWIDEDEKNEAANQEE